MAESRNHHREDRCPVDDDPAACSIRQNCHYWSRDLGCCNYAAVKAMRERRRREEAADRSGIMARIRLTP